MKTKIITKSFSQQPFEHSGNLLIRFSLKKKVLIPHVCTICSRSSLRNQVTVLHLQQIHVQIVWRLFTVYSMRCYWPRALWWCNHAWFKKKKRAQVTNWSDLVCLMCPFFVPKVIRNLVALLMYSERYWLINALSAHNPLGSVKGTGEKTCSFSQYVFSPLPVVQKTSGFYLFIYLFFFLSFCWQRLRDKRLNICQVMHSKQHWSSWMSIQLLWKAWRGIALLLAHRQCWPPKEYLVGRLHLL